MRTCSRCGVEHANNHAYCSDCHYAYRNTPEQKAKRAEYARTKYQRDERAAYKKKRIATVQGRALSMFDNAKRRADTKALPFDLTREWIESKLSGRCELTGRTFDLRTGTHDQRVNPNAPSLDRRDPRKGYTRDNVRFVVAHANLARHMYTDAELVALCEDVLRTISSQGSLTSKVQRPSREGVGASVPKRTGTNAVHDMVSSVQ